VVAFSVSGMGGGHDATFPGPAQQPGLAPPDELARSIEARRAQAVHDGEVLAGVPFVAEALARLAAAVDDLLSVRWSALSGGEMAAVGGLARQQARLDAAVLGSVKAVDDRDDVVPGGRANTAGPRFLLHALGLDRRVAAREAETARLLCAGSGDLAAMGAAYAAGDISRGHVDVATRVRRRLHTGVRDALVATVDPATGEESERRCIEVVDDVLARQARALTVPDLQRAADRLIEHLDPPSSEGAHQRRYLHLAQLPDGSLVGRFACGPAQALAFQAVIAAGAAPQPGIAIDPDGVERAIPDDRSIGQRRMDALADALATAAGGCNTASGLRARGGGGGGDAGSLPEPAPEPAPEPEGREEIRRQVGVRTGPYPSAEILVTVTLDQLAAALSLHRDLPQGSGRNEAGNDPPRPWPDPRPADHDRGSGDLHRVEGFGRAQLGGPVHPRTLAMLTCSARLRAIVVDAHGGVLHLGRASRLASPAQRRGLLARDSGCVIPGCAVPGEHCDVHHVIPWAAGGTTDLPNLALLCPRHHAEVDEPGGWQIHMIHGVPWVRPPAWAGDHRALLRNATHHPSTGTA